MKSIVLVFTMLIVSFASAATYTTTATPGTWDLGAEPGVTPTTSDNIIVNHDWSGYNWAASSARSWYAATLTVNSGGYLYLNGSMSNWSGTITINSGGVLHINGANHVAGGAVTVDGLLDVNGAFQKDVAIGGTGTISAGSLAGAGVISGTITLPVELINFTVTKNFDDNIIRWSTASEVNNDYFGIEASDNGITFDEVTQVLGYGNSSEINEYSYLDIAVDGGKYYRLKQVDYNGNFEYSHVVHSGSAEKDVSIIQKMTSNELIILSNEDKVYNVELFDVSGVLVHAFTYLGTEGQRTNFKVLHDGVLFVKVSDDNSMSVKKIVIH